MYPYVPLYVDPSFPRNRGTVRYRQAPGRSVWKKTRLAPSWKRSQVTRLLLSWRRQGRPGSHYMGG